MILLINLDIKKKRSLESSLVAINSSLERAAKVKEKEKVKEDDRFT
jgi:hypothetical protein